MIGTIDGGGCSDLRGDGKSFPYFAAGAGVLEVSREVRETICLLGISEKKICQAYNKG